jgi:SAM-dependent methyltransferase
MMSAGMRPKAAVARGLRSTGLLGVVDDILARTEHVRGYFARRNFLQSNPDFILPPTELAYDAYGPWDPETYRTQGTDHAAYIAGLIKQYRPGAKVICEWGCGPMRVLRHMRRHFPSERLIGLDYNRRTIDWCSGNFADIEFLANSLQPPLPLRDGEADAIYAISVLTHLSERLHRDYADDLLRCLAPGGILIVTLHGDRYVGKLSRSEHGKYEQGEVVIRDHVTEGKRVFVAFHSPDSVRRLFHRFQILRHDTNERIMRFHQDTWVMAKQG